MLLCSTSTTPRRAALKTSQGLAQKISFRPHGANPVACIIKGYATSASHKAKKDVGRIKSMKADALTLLHKTNHLFPRILESNANSGFPRTRELQKTWEKVLSDAHEDLSVAAERPAKIVVCGWDESSGAQDLVTALLVDPLSSGAPIETLEGRWRDHRSRVNIINENASDPGSSSFRVSSNYLQQFPIPVEITEFRPPSTFIHGNDTAAAVTTTAIEADILILVCNPLTTSLPELLNAQIPSNTIVVLTSLLTLDEIEVRRATLHASSKTPEWLSTDPRLALEGIRALQAEPHSISAIQQYQRNFVSSRISDVTKALQTKLAREPHLPSVRTNLALNHISDALHYSLSVIQQAHKEVDAAFLSTMRLEGEIGEALTKAPEEVFGRRDPNTGRVELNEIDEALKQAEREMRQVMDKLTWWRMIWRVDEISGIVSSALRQSWCYGLERKLIMQTGRLATLQEKLSQASFSLLSGHPSISTAVLRNSLLQLQSSPHHPLVPDSLTQPLCSRRNQIIEYPTARLHVTGQRAVLGMTGGILSGVGVGWAGWLGWLLGSGEGLLGFLGMDATTAMGVGMLGAVASVRWAVGTWEKSKKRWWQDWTRAGEGLDRDLKDTLSKSMKDQVVIVAETACTEMTKLKWARDQEIQKFRAEVRNLQAEADSIPREADRS